MPRTATQFVNAALVAVVLIVTVGTPEVLAGDDSPTLKRIAQERSSWQNGRVRWKSTVKSQHRPPFIYETRHSADDRISTCFGDEQGALARSPDGQAVDIGKGPMHSLFRKGERWQYFEGDLIAERHDTSECRIGVDARNLGLAPSGAPGATVSEMLFSDGSLKWDFSESRFDDRILVIATSGEHRREWSIDPERGGLPVRIQTFHGETLVTEARITLEKHEGDWYPKVVEHFRTDAGGGLSLDERIEVLEFEKNVATIPREGFTPLDLGIDNGVMVIGRNADGTSKGITMWADGELLEQNEYGRRLWHGKTKDGERYRANFERLSARAAARNATRTAAEARQTGKSAIVMTVETEWERHVRLFVDSLKYDDDQTQKAMLHLEAAKADAQRFATRHKAELDALDRELAELEPLSADEKIERLKMWNEKRKKLLEPLDDILNEKLMPRVKELMTTAQREEFSSRRPASQPAASAPATTTTLPVGG